MVPVIAQSLSPFGTERLDAAAKGSATAAAAAAAGRVARERFAESPGMHQLLVGHK